MMRDNGLACRPAGRTSNGGYLHVWITWPSCRALARRPRFAGQFGGRRSHGGGGGRVRAVPAGLRPRHVIERSPRRVRRRLHAALPDRLALRAPHHLQGAVAGRHDRAARRAGLGRVRRLHGPAYLAGGVRAPQGVRARHAAAGGAGGRAAHRDHDGPPARAAGVPGGPGRAGGDRLDRPDRGVGARRARAADRGAARGAGGRMAVAGPGFAGAPVTRWSSATARPRRVSVRCGPRAGSGWLTCCSGPPASTRWRWSGARPGASASRTTR